MRGAQAPSLLNLCSTLLSPLQFAQPNPHTPRGVVVEQSICSTCSTLLNLQSGQVEQPIFSEKAAPEGRQVLRKRRERE
jgi:hypothetical protein